MKPFCFLFSFVSYSFHSFDLAFPFVFASHFDLVYLAAFSVVSQ